MLNQELKIRLTVLMKRWYSPLKYSEEPDWHAKYYKAERLIQKELLEFLKQNHLAIPLDIYAKIVGRGGTTGKLYKFALSEILTRKLSCEEIRKFIRGQMALKDACQIYMKSICENKPSVREIIRIFASGNSDKFETMLASAIRDRYSREVYKEIQRWRRMRNKKEFERKIKKGWW